MKKIFIPAMLLITVGCSGEQAEEFAFRKVMEYQLKDDCGEKDKACLKAIEAQIEACMIESDWRRYLENEENEEELQRFIRAFFPCFKDAQGNPYFDLGQ